tara:strand:- start:1380 stop:2051 length:672 start_codon:yes stop_codon:yes gene_type:complete
MGNYISSTLGFTDRTYDIEITIGPESIKDDFGNFKIKIEEPWQINDIINVQGEDYLMICQKYTGAEPTKECLDMAKLLEESGANILRRKIKLHFDGSAPEFTGNSHPGGGLLDKPIEVHYKYIKKGIFEVTREKLDEFNAKKMILSFNRSNEMPIASFRYKNYYCFSRQNPSGNLPHLMEEVDYRVVIYDDNANIDSFWPMRVEGDIELSFGDFPIFYNLIVV